MNGDVRVLVVDDSDFFATLVAGELASLYGMDIETATSATEALDRLDEDGFDCVVSDYDMPELNGIELFEQLRERGIDLPFILLTAAGSEEVASEAITAGVTDYFSKSRGQDQFEILGQRIQNVVSQRRAQRDLQRQRQLHEDLWKVTQDLVRSPTRDEIDRNVCRRLAEVDRFAFAWISDGETDGVRAVAGLDRADLQAVREALGDDGRSPTVAAMGDRTVRTATIDAPSGVESDAIGGQSGDGSERVEVVAVPLLYQDRTYGVLGLATTAGEELDEGEREGLERLGSTVGHALAAVEIQREVETFREAVDQADAAVLITDTDGTIEYVNRAFEEITGYSDEDARGAAFEDVVTGEWDAERADTVRERVREGEPIREEIVQHRADGTQFHADLSVAPIALDGEIEKFVAVESDITDLKTREQRLQVLNRILRHNLRNDVNVIEGHLALLLDAVANDEVRSHAERASAKLDELLALSEKVRTVDRAIRTAGNRDASSAVDLADLLAAEADRVREEYPDATVDLDVTGATVRASHLDVAVRELLVNAVEHNDDPHPHVSVSAGRDGAPDGFVTVTVEDDGPGIPDVERTVLERGEETKLEHGQSLGLWLVNWVVTHAGGDLDIEDAPDGGSIVRLSLPVAAG